MGIGTIWHCALVSCTPSLSIRLFFGCALFPCWLSLCAPFTISLIEFYFIMIFTMTVVTVTRIFMSILFIFKDIFRLSVIKYLRLCQCTTPWMFPSMDILLVLDGTWYFRTPLCHVYIPYLDILQGSFRLCNWLSLRRLLSWINHWPPVCWSTFPLFGILV